MSTTRRSFLGAAGIAGLGAAGATPSFARIEPAPWGIKLGIATYSLRSFDRARAIDMIKAIQTPWVSIKDVHLSQKGSKAEIQAGAKEFTDAGLTITSGGNVNMKEDSVEGLRPHFEYARAAGMPMMVCSPTHENLKYVEQLVKEYDIRAAIHNHGPEDKQFPTPQSVLEAVRDPGCALRTVSWMSGTRRAQGQTWWHRSRRRGAGCWMCTSRIFRDFTGKLTPAFGQCDMGDGYYAVPCNLQTIEEDELPGLRQPGVRDPRKGSDARGWSARSATCGECWRGWRRPRPGHFSNTIPAEAVSETWCPA